MKVVERWNTNRFEYLKKLTDSADDLNAEIGRKFANMTFFGHHATGLIFGHGRMEWIFTAHVGAIAR